MHRILSVTVLLAVATIGGLWSAEAAKPSMVDFGSKTCIPCKMMKPILDELETTLADKATIEFVDVNVAENRPRAQQAGIRLIPTQIFYDASGKEVHRHEGYLGKFAILAQFEKMKVIDNADAYLGIPKVERWKPAAKDERSAEERCFFSDATIDPARAVHIVTADGTGKHLADLHTFFIMLSCLQTGIEDTESRSTVASAVDGAQIPVTTAVYLYGLNAESGRPWIRAYGDQAAAIAARAEHGGTVLSYAVLKAKELEHRCGFCDRSVYAADASVVEVDGLKSWGCCAHCALGVAARLQKDIVVHQPDGHSGEMITIKTMDGQIESIAPEGAFAWYGKKQKADGSWTSAGCFHQGNFVSEANLRAWLEARPLETGKAISIDRALYDKMQMTPKQIAGACKLGSCE
jgi:thioredoxin 1